MFASLFAVLISSSVWLCPNPADKHGWILRLRVSEVQQPLIARENLESYRFLVVLLNQSQALRKYTPLQIAVEKGDLQCYIVCGNGKALRSMQEPFSGKKVPEKLDLRAYESVTSSFSFGSIGYHTIPDTGEYKLNASMHTLEGRIYSPFVKFAVIEPTPSQILSSQSITLEGYLAKWPNKSQPKIEIQQIQIDDKVWLFYRQFLAMDKGGEISSAYRIAELPGKRDIKVEGAYGEGGR